MLLLAVIISPPVCGSRNDIEGDQGAVIKKNRATIVVDILRLATAELTSFDKPDTVIIVADDCLVCWWQSRDTTVVHCIVG